MKQMKYAQRMMPYSTLGGVKTGAGYPVRIMGVINVSPESFYNESVKNKKTIMSAARRMEEEGADFIDIGAMSTAPYLKTAISEQEETERISWAVKLVRKACRLPISVDSTRATVAEAGLRAGGQIINDVSGLRMDPRMVDRLPLSEGAILMAHPVGLPLNDKGAREPLKIISQLLSFSLLNALQRIKISKIALDPGIGFFRNQSIDWWKWDLDILAQLEKLQTLGPPLMVGVSRKSFIGELLGKKPATERLYGSLGATIVAVQKGAAIIRTHDVASTKEAVIVAEKIMQVRVGRKI